MSASSSAARPLTTAGSPSPSTAPSAAPSCRVRGVRVDTEACGECHGGAEPRQSAPIVASQSEVICSVRADPNKLSTRRFESHDLNVELKLGGAGLHVFFPRSSAARCSSRRTCSSGLGFRKHALFAFGDMVPTRANVNNHNCGCSSRRPKSLQIKLEENGWIQKHVTNIRRHRLACPLTELFHFERGDRSTLDTDLRMTLVKSQEEAACGETAQHPESSILALDETSIFERSDCSVLMTISQMTLANGAERKEGEDRTS